MWQSLFMLTYTINLNNGRIARLKGSGPPVVFSSGLFGICPHQAYSQLDNLLSRNLTMIHMEGGVKFMTKDDVETVADALQVDQVGFFAHSSFDPSILESSRVKKAVLCDPIGIPQIKNILQTKSLQPYIKTDAKTLEIKASKLYNGEFELPMLNQYNIDGDVTSVEFDSGHVDLMDDLWVWLAEKIGLWETISPPTRSFENFKLPQKQNVKKIRQDYRKSLADTSIGFLMS